jgi:hypothetical protein
VKYRIADLLGMSDRTGQWHKRLGWSPFTYLRTSALTITEKSIQLRPLRPRYILGLGREWYLDPATTRIGRRQFQRFLPPRRPTEFILFCGREHDGTLTDLFAITGDNLREIEAAVKASGVANETGTP